MPNSEAQDFSIHQLVTLVLNGKRSISLSFINLVSSKVNENDGEEIKRRENLIMELAEKMSKANDIEGTIQNPLKTLIFGENFLWKIFLQIEGLTKLLTSLRPHLLSYGMAKASKLIRNLIDWCLKIGRQSDFKLALCMEYVSWAKQQNRIFLRYMLEVRLMRLLNEMGRHTDVLTMGAKLKNELKKVESKDIQLEIHLEESKAAFALNNLNRSRTALATARTIANSLCIETKLQAQLDMASGILHMAEDRDFKTAYSYFYEAFENFGVNEDEVNARKALKYMCLAKIMLNEEREVRSLLSGKEAVKYSGRDLDAIKNIATAFENRSLQDYYKVLINWLEKEHFLIGTKISQAIEKYNVELQSDLIFHRYIDSLADTVLEMDISRAIEPYSLIEMTTLAKNIRIPVEQIERKLAQMILDKKFQGMIDQQDGTLTVYSFPHDEQTKTFIASVEVIRGLSEVNL
uniref:PCI domain-containing protein n=1 Tax=Elaeophora elaphi TaxID=1147741 RepID=A0A0R3RJ85_9BILA